MDTVLTTLNLAIANPAAADFLSSLADWALASLVSYGVLLLLVSTYVGSLGLPFPNTLLIVAAGAFGRQGLLDWHLAGLACLAGAMLADHSEYLLGRLAGGRLAIRFEDKAAWKRAKAVLDRQGGWAIVLTRFWLTPLAPAVNLIAGSRYPYARFVLFDLVGQLLWIGLYGGLGYLFASQWRLVSQAISGFTGLSVGVVALAAAIYFLVQWRRRIQRRRLEASRP